jgi:hypothetical protein
MGAPFCLYLLTFDIHGKIKASSLYEVFPVIGVAIPAGFEPATHGE